MKFSPKARGGREHAPTRVLCLFPIFIFARVSQNSDSCAFVFPSNFALTIVGKMLPDAFSEKKRKERNLHVDILSK